MGLDLSTGSLGLLAHALSVGIDTHVGLLDGLGSLSLKGETSTGIGGDSVTDHAGNRLGIGSNAGSESLAGKGRAGMGSSSTLLESLHLLHRITDSDSEVLLGNTGGRADSIEHLLLHLSASLLGLQGESLNRGVGLVTELGDLSVELVVGEPAGVLVHLGTTLLDKLGTLLTLGNSLTDGVVELVLVGILEGSDLTTALGILLAHDDSELVDLLTEHSLGLANLVDGIEAHATGGSSHLRVLLGLHSLVLPESTPHSGGTLAELVLGVLAVLGELGTDRGESLVKLHGHAVQLAVGLSLTLVNQLLKLDIVMEVLLVTLVTELDHTAHLSVHISVNLGLGSTVGTHNTSGGINPVVHLGHLLLHGGRKLEETNLELSLSSSDLLRSISASSSDVADSLSIALSLESLLGIQGSLETHGSLLQGHIDIVTLLGHLGLDIVELSRSGSNKSLDLVVSPGAGGLVLGRELGRKTAASGLGVAAEVLDLVVPRVHGVLKVLAGLLGVLLDLSSVGSDVLVHAVDASVGGGCPRRGGSLPAMHSETKVLGLLTAIMVGHRDGATVTTESGTVPAVGKASLLGETLLGLAHSVVEVVTTLLSVHCHLVQHLPLELGTGGSIECKVASHLGADRRDVGLAVGHFVRDFLLDVVEVVHQAHL